MRAGRLDQRVTLLRRDVGTASSGSGLQIEEFVQVAKVWATVTPARGGESFTGVQRFSETTHVFRIRFRDALDTTWRLRWRGQDFDIVEALPGGERLREYIDVMASASSAENPNR